MNRFLRVTTLLMMMFCMSQSGLFAQRLGVSTNLFGIATLSPNLGLELVTSPRSTLRLDVDYNPWDLSDNLSFQHERIGLGYRYWFSQSMYGHFAGVSTSYTAYDLALSKDDKWVGSCADLGISYGYGIVLSDHWNLTPSIGFGVAVNNEKIANEDHGYSYHQSVTPTVTEFSLTLQYIIK